MKCEFLFSGVAGTSPGWRRCGHDRYGENVETGQGYGYNGGMTQGQRGRVWPFVTGKRGHYELARAKQSGDLGADKVNSSRNTYVKGMEMFANKGVMLPEQAWGGVGNNDV